MLNAFIIVWRESLEAMLVIGVLLAWIARQPTPALLREGVWIGAGAGVGLALMLGFATFAVHSQLAGATLEFVQLGMVLGAALLILHMVLWMHHHGRHMKRAIEAQASQTAGAFGIGAIAALAVAREGAETVIFLYGLGLEAQGLTLAGLIGAAGAGLLVAVATAWGVARGARFLSLRTLFLASEILLLLIANALLANGIDRMIALEWLPTLADPAWDVSDLLADGQGAGRFLADFAGYRARPAGTLVGASLAFWGFAFWRMARIDKATAHA